MLFRPGLRERYNDPKVNTNAYLCMYPPGAAAFGKGKLGGACSPTLERHGIIMSYDYSDMIVARVSVFDAEILVQTDKQTVPIIPIRIDQIIS